MKIWSMTPQHLSTLTTAELREFVLQAREVYRDAREKAEYDDWAYTNGRMESIRELALTIALAKDLADKREAAA